MITVRLDRCGERSAGATVYAYQVAGQAILADRELGWLRPFAVAGALPSLPSLSSLAFPARGDNATILFEGRAFLARRQRHLCCRHFPGSFELEVEGLGHFRLAEEEERLEVVKAAADAPPELLEEVLLGPLLALALARQGIFLLHAGGCGFSGASWLFLGESGAGKSTLAARLSAAPGGLLLADDQAAVDASSGELLADFPQPKLAPVLQERLAFARRRQLAGIVLLEKGPAADEPQLLNLAPMLAAAGIVRHSTAVRCFDHRLLRANLDFAVALSAQVPCFRLLYPHHPDAPQKIGALLAQL